MYLYLVVRLINKYHNGLTFIINIIFFFLNLWFSARQKLKLDKEMEKYKQDLQAEFIKTQIKTTQIFKIYPEMFSHFKNAQSKLGQLKVLREQKSTKIEAGIKEAETYFVKANNYLVYNMLFLSEKVKNISIELTEMMFDYLYYESICYDDIVKVIYKLECQMREELKNKDS